MRRCDVIIVGLGHAGCEAALACARMGLDTVGVTLKRDRIAVMSCNPAIGGTAKGHLVRELDALGGEMARAADLAGTHFITLNGSKGPAVQATRVLCDREAYAQVMQTTLAAQPRLEVVEQEVSSLNIEQGRVVGVTLGDGSQLVARAVVLTTGTFLSALMHVGAERSEGGRVGDAAAYGLSRSLAELGFTLGRFKTGTPARLKRDTIDFSRCTPQPGDATPRPFSLRTPKAPFPLREQVECSVTFTNELTHAVLRDNLHASPLYQGHIVGRGPRYCPSVEDKVVRFPQRDRHTIFLEPEGVSSNLVYPAGLSTSMPAEVQLAMLRTILGLEEVEVERFGYAVEYDYSVPTQLWPTLEARQVKGLFFGGQLNGSSGYEEAAFQGLVAGINAGLQVRGEPALVLERIEAHGAVLIDEMVTKGVDEPFRMLTSRSEHRLRLREGNADLRLRAHGHRVGLVRADELAVTVARAEAISGELLRLEQRREAVLLRRPGMTWAALPTEGRPVLPAEVVSEVETEARYAGYIAQADAAWTRRADLHDGWPIPESVAYRDIRGLSKEACEKLTALRPATVGQARRVPGITPAAVTLILVHLRRAAVEKAVRNDDGAGS